MGNVVDAYIEVISGLRGEIYTLRAELEEARASEEGAHMIIAAERAEVAQLRRRVADLEAEIAKLTAERDAAQADAEDWARKCAAADEMLDAAVAGAVKVKPLDLSKLLKHAFICGRASAGGASSFHGEAWADYDPTESEAYSRILSAIPPADLAAKIGGE